MFNFKTMFLSNLHYFYAKTDGSYGWPSQPNGQLLRRAKKEIEHLVESLNDLSLEMDGVNYTHHYRERIEEILKGVGCENRERA